MRRVAAAAGGDPDEAAEWLAWCREFTLACIGLAHADLADLDEGEAS